MKIAKKLFGSVNDRVLRPMYRNVEAINALEPAFEKLSDAELAGKTAEFRARLEKGETLDDILNEAFATVRETSKRCLGMRHFDVQLIGGIVLHNGMISEMKTGEGKTLVATLAVYLNALTSKGVHVVTVNDYLAKRDAEWMGQIYKFLGLTVGCVIDSLQEEGRQAAYNCDIIYATNNELGFDYLRDNLKFKKSSMVQREFNYAIVDEVDSILVDEARTPLIISGPTEDNSELYIKINKLIPKLKEDDIEVDEKSKTALLTEKGAHTIEFMLREHGMLEEGANLYDIQNLLLVHHVNQALKAHKIFANDVDYIVKDGKVVIIDEFTGRMQEGRRYSEGLHQALEAKENVPVQNENQTLASITYQNLFRMYKKLSGMTGTAMTEAQEFADIYGLFVVEIPTHVDVSRVDEDDLVYRSVEEKFDAIVEAIVRAHKRHQPVLVGTVSIEKSELVSKFLKDKKYISNMGKNFIEKGKAVIKEVEKNSGKDNKELLKLAAEYKEMGEYLLEISKKSIPVPHNVLNAKFHAQEAPIIAQAGRPGAVTIATNMAGRGTDIKLGGNPEMSEEKWDVETEKKEVLSAGGLFVLGTERHESRRIDNQLRGRSGRQGDPGLSRFYLSLQDDLMRIFGSDKLEGILKFMKMEKGESISARMLTKVLETAQKRVEGRNFEVRKNLLKFDDVMNDQRKIIYGQRLEIMDAEDVSEKIREYRESTVDDLVYAAIPEKSYPESWDIEGLEKELRRVFGIEIPVKEWAAEEGVGEKELLEKVHAETEALMALKERKIDAPSMRNIEKQVLLVTLDQIWKEHLHSLDSIKQGIGLRAYGQKDPLNEYKHEAFRLFEYMLRSLAETVTERMAHIEIHAGETVDLLEKKQRELKMKESHGFLGEEEQAPQQQGTVRHLSPENRDPRDPETWGKVARNEACPCGSGQKYKHCHGKLI